MSADTTRASSIALALDVGGMSIKSGLVMSNGDVIEFPPVPIDHRAGAEEIIATFLRAMANTELTSVPLIAIAIPSPFDYASGVSMMTHKFAALHGVDIGSALHDALATLNTRTVQAIRFVNDAAAAGAGEIEALPDARGSTLVLTLGTGMGSSLFDNGQLVERRNTLQISELWSRSLQGDAASPPNGSDSTLADSLFSATGLARFLDTETAQLQATIENGAVDGLLVAWGRRLGEFLAELTPLLGLDRAVIGGGAGAAFTSFAPGVLETAPIEVVQAKLGSKGPLLGAAALASDSSTRGLRSLGAARPDD